eukprot:TRINITY_DN5258_c0_g1_i1.p1 TRINITY_DN5258_c0_g1~~TRINITY_DN5258_c0_g1_i1.p1  ORF type:complete len:398 (+),score=124.34 TRINITY_DN5258_c0_g1_i1:97-1290(+)
MSTTSTTKRKTSTRKDASDPKPKRQRTAAPEVGTDGQPTPATASAPSSSAPTPAAPSPASAASSTSSASGDIDIEQEGQGLVFCARHKNPNKKDLFHDVVCSSAATFRHLDTFIRSAWLDADHLSVFIKEGDGDRVYELPLPEDSMCGGSFPVSDYVSTHVRPGDECGYLYDFGSPTHLILSARAATRDELQKCASAVPPFPVVELRDKVEGEGAAACAEVENVAGEVDARWPSLATQVFEFGSTLVAGRPHKRGNPYITRMSPFFCTIYNEGGELNNGPVASGDYKGSEVVGVFDEVESVCKNWDRVGSAEADEEDEDSGAQDSAGSGSIQAVYALYPRVFSFLGRGKNTLQLGGDFGNTVVLQKGNALVMASNQFTTLHSCFQACESALKAIESR